RSGRSSPSPPARAHRHPAADASRGRIAQAASRRMAAPRASRSAPSRARHRCPVRGQRGRSAGSRSRMRPRQGTSPALLPPATTRGPPRRCRAGVNPCASSTVDRTGAAPGAKQSYFEGRLSVTLPEVFLVFPVPSCAVAVASADTDLWLATSFLPALVSGTWTFELFPAAIEKVALPSVTIFFLPLEVMTLWAV